MNHIPSKSSKTQTKNRANYYEASKKEPYDMQDPQYRKIFVGGLPHNLALYEFRNYFEKFGNLVDCVILKDKRT